VAGQLQKRRINYCECEGRPAHSDLESRQSGHSSIFVDSACSTLIFSSNPSTDQAPAVFAENLLICSFSHIYLILQREWQRRPSPVNLNVKMLSLLKIKECSEHLLNSLVDMPLELHS